MLLSIGESLVGGGMSIAGGLESLPFLEGGFKSREEGGEEDRLFRARVLLFVGVEGVLEVLAAVEIDATEFGAAATGRSRGLEGSFVAVARAVAGSFSDSAGKLLSSVSSALFA